MFVCFQDVDRAKELDRMEARVGELEDKVIRLDGKLAILVAKKSKKKASQILTLEEKVRLMKVLTVSDRQRCGIS